MREIGIQHAGTVLPASTHRDTGTIVIHQTHVIKSFLLAVPLLCVAATCVVGWAVQQAIGARFYGTEMAVAAIINAATALAAVGALLMVMDRSAATIARTSLAATSIRIMGVLMATLMATGPGWGFNTTALLYWVLALYLVLLVAESWIAIWIVRRTRH